MKKILSLILVALMIASCLCIQAAAVDNSDANDAVVAEQAEELLQEETAIEESLQSPRGTINGISVSAFSVSSVYATSFLNSVKTEGVGKYYTGSVNSSNNSDVNNTIKFSFGIEIGSDFTTGGIKLPIDKLYNTSACSGIASSTANPFFKANKWSYKYGNNPNVSLTVQTDGNGNQYLFVPIQPQAAGSNASATVLIDGVFNWDDYATKVPKNVQFFEKAIVTVDGVETEIACDIKSTHYDYYSSTAAKVTDNAIRKAYLYTGETATYNIFTPYMGLTLNNNRTPKWEPNQMIMRAGTPVLTTVTRIPAGVDVTLPSALNSNATLTGNSADGWVLTYSIDSVEQLLAYSPYSGTEGTYSQVNKGAITYSASTVLRDLSIAVPDNTVLQSLNISTTTTAYTREETATRTDNYLIKILPATQDFYDATVDTDYGTDTLNLKDFSQTSSSSTVGMCYNNGNLPILDLKVNWTNDSDLPANVKYLRNEMNYSADITITLINRSGQTEQIEKDIPANNYVFINSSITGRPGQTISVDSDQWIKSVTARPYYMDNGEKKYAVKEKYFAQTAIPLGVCCSVPANGKNIKTGASLQSGDISHLITTVTFDAISNTNIYYDSASKTFIDTAPLYDRPYAPTNGDYAVVTTERSIRYEMPKTGYYSYSIVAAADANPNAGTNESPTQVPLTLKLYSIVNGISPVPADGAGSEWQNPTVVMVLPMGIHMDTTYELTYDSNTGIYTHTGGNYTMEQLEDSDNREAWRIVEYSNTSLERGGGDVANENMRLLCASGAVAGTQYFDVYMSSTLAEPNEFVVMTFAGQSAVADTMDYDNDGLTNDEIVHQRISLGFNIRAAYEINFSSEAKDANGNFFVVGTGSPISAPIGANKDYRTNIINDGNVQVSNITITDTLPSFSGRQCTLLDESVVVDIVNADGIVVETLSPSVTLSANKAVVTIQLGSFVLNPGLTIRISGTFTVPDTVPPTITAKKVTSVLSKVNGEVNPERQFGQDYVTLPTLVFRFFDTAIPEGGTPNDVDTELLETKRVEQGVAFKLPKRTLSDTSLYPDGIPERDGYVFGGWIDGAANDRSVAVTAAGLEAGTVANGMSLPTALKNENASIMATADRDFYATWIKIGTIEKNSEDKMVRFSADQGSNTLDLGSKEFDFIGVNIRYIYNGNGKTGLRFLSRMSTSLTNKINDLNAAEQITQVGHVVAQKAHVQLMGELRDGKEKVKKSPNVDTHFACRDYIIFTTVINNIPVENYVSDVAARPYIEYMDINGFNRMYYYEEKDSASKLGKAYYTNISRLANYIIDCDTSGQLPEMVVRYLTYIKNNEPIFDDEFWYAFHNY